MELRDALDQISEIRQRMLRAQVFHGYRSATVASMGVVGGVTAVLQACWIPQPLQHVNAYVALWASAAALCAGAAVVELTIRWIRCGSSLQRDLTALAVGQLAPSLFAGALLTAILLRFAPQVAWMLPGLWAILFSMGVFASRNVLSPLVFVPAAWYLLAGAVCLAIGAEHPLSPWLMGLTFGPGQLLSAAAVYFGVERPSHDPQE